MRTHRTTIDIDLDSYSKARESLGTRGYKDTVNAALRQVARDHALRKAAERIREGGHPAPEPEQLTVLRSRRTA